MPPIEDLRSIHTEDIKWTAFPAFPPALLMIALFVRGVGMGVATIPLTSTPYVGLEAGDVPSASVISRVVQQIGGSLGVAVLAVILTSASGTDPAAAFRASFWWSVAFAAVAVPLCLLLPGGPDRTDDDRSQESRPEPAASAGGA